MKRVLILVLSTENPDVQGRGPKYHYLALKDIASKTWDAEEVEGVETIFYFARSDKPSSDKILYTDTDDNFWSMGRKTLLAFDYALANRQFDYILRANSSLYVHKEKLLRYVQGKPETGLALGVCAPYVDGSLYLWGPAYLLSRDIVQLICDNKNLWDHERTDDASISHVLHQLGIPLDNRGSLCSVAMDNPFPGYNFVYYEDGHGGQCSMTDLKEIEHMLPNQFGFRVKCDHDRSVDIQLMQELHATFTK